MPFEIKIIKTEQYPVFILKDTSNNSEVEIYAFGGIVNAFKINIDNEILNVIDGFENVLDAVTNISKGFKSAKLSPFVCRMNKGEYSFNKIDYKIEKFYLQQHAIHGIIYDVTFTMVENKTDESKAELILQHIYEGTDIGYPFNYTTTITYILTSENKLNITTTVQHNNDFEIPYADGWHPYFTLGNSIDECNLQFDSTQMIEFNETLLPTGNTIVDETFVEGKLMKAIFLDNCFAMKSSGKCVLKNDKLQLVIEADENYPYLQIYTPDHRQSIALENLSAVPDCFNNYMGLLLLQPNKAYTFTTSYQVKNI